MTASILIRPMQPADLERVLAIAASLPSAPHWPLDSYKIALDPESAPARIALAAESEDALAGFAIASLLGPQAELESIAVAPEAQRQGIAAGLLRILCERARLAGAEEILLEVRTSNLPAIHLYQRQGFTEIGRRSGYYSDPAEDAIVFHLGLIPARPRS